MTKVQYQAKLIAYLKDQPSARALELIALIVSDWLMEPNDVWGDHLNMELFGPPVTCPECGSSNLIPDICWNCERELTPREPER
jgi:hypothetical protein